MNPSKQIHKTKQFLAEKSNEERTALNAILNNEYQNITAEYTEMWREAEANALRNAQNVLSAKEKQEVGRKTIVQTFLSKKLQAQSLIKKTHQLFVETKNLAVESKLQQQIELLNNKVQQLQYIMQQFPEGLDFVEQLSEIELKFIEINLSLLQGDINAAVENLHLLESRTDLITAIKEDNGLRRQWNRLNSLLVNSVAAALKAEAIRLFKDITPKEWNEKQEASTARMAMIAWSAKLEQYVLRDLLEAENLGDFFLRFSCWAEIAKACRDKGDYHSMSLIYGTLQKSSIYRLSDFANLGIKIPGQAVLEEIRKQFFSTPDFKKLLSSVLEEGNSSIIPFVGWIETTLVAIDEGKPESVTKKDASRVYDLEGGGLLNPKMQVREQVVAEVTSSSELISKINDESLANPQLIDAVNAGIEISIAEQDQKSFNLLSREEKRASADIKTKIPKILASQLFADIKTDEALYDINAAKSLINSIIINKQLDVCVQCEGNWTVNDITTVNNLFEFAANFSLQQLLDNFQKLKQLFAVHNINLTDQVKDEICVNGIDEPFVRALLQKALEDNLEINNISPENVKKFNEHLNNGEFVDAFAILQSWGVTDLTIQQFIHLVKVSQFLMQNKQIDGYLGIINERDIRKLHSMQNFSAFYAKYNELNTTIEKIEENSSKYRDLYVQKLDEAVALHERLHDINVHGVNIDELTQGIDLFVKNLDKLNLDTEVFIAEQLPQIKSQFEVLLPQKMQLFVGEFIAKTTGVFVKIRQFLAVDHSQQDVSVVEQKLNELAMELKLLENDIESFGKIQKTRSELIPPELAEIIAEYSKLTQELTHFNWELSLRKYVWRNNEITTAPQFVKGLTDKAGLSAIHENIYIVKTDVAPIPLRINGAITVNGNKIGGVNQEQRNENFQEAIKVFPGDIEKFLNQYLSSGAKTAGIHLQFFSGLQNLLAASGKYSTEAISNIDIYEEHGLFKVCMDWSIIGIKERATDLDILKGDVTQPVIKLNATILLDPVNNEPGKVQTQVETVTLAVTAEAEKKLPQLKTQLEVLDENRSIAEIALKTNADQINNLDFAKILSVETAITTRLIMLVDFDFTELKRLQEVRKLKAQGETVIADADLISNQYKLASWLSYINIDLQKFSKNLVGTAKLYAKLTKGTISTRDVQKILSDFLGRAIDKAAARKIKNKAYFEKIDPDIREWVAHLVEHKLVSKNLVAVVSGKTLDVINALNKSYKAKDGEAILQALEKFGIVVSDRELADFMQVADNLTAVVNAENIADIAKTKTATKPLAVSGLAEKAASKSSEKLEYVPFVGFETEDLKYAPISAPDAVQQESLVSATGEEKARIELLQREIGGVKKRLLPLLQQNIENNLPDITNLEVQLNHELKILGNWFISLENWQQVSFNNGEMLLNQRVAEFIAKIAEFQNKLQVKREDCWRKELVLSDNLATEELVKIWGGIERDEMDKAKASPKRAWLREHDEFLWKRTHDSRSLYFMLKKYSWETTEFATLPEFLTIDSDKFTRVTQDFSTSAQNHIGQSFTDSRAQRIMEQLLPVLPDYLKAVTNNAKLELTNKYQVNISSAKPSEVVVELLLDTEAIVDSETGKVIVSKVGEEKSPVQLKTKIVFNYDSQNNFVGAKIANIDFAFVSMVSEKISAIENNLYYLDWWSNIKDQTERLTAGESIDTAWLFKTLAVPKHNILMHLAANPQDVRALDMLMAIYDLQLKAQAQAQPEVAKNFAKIQQNLRAWVAYLLAAEGLELKAPDGSAATLDAIIAEINRSYIARDSGALISVLQNLGIKNTGNLDEYIEALKIYAGDIKSSSELKEMSCTELAILQRNVQAYLDQLEQNIIATMDLDKTQALDLIFSESLQGLNRFYNAILPELESKKIVAFEVVANNIPKIEKAIDAFHHANIANKSAEAAIKWQEIRSKWEEISKTGFAIEQFEFEIKPEFVERFIKVQHFVDGVKAKFVDPDIKLAKLLTELEDLRNLDFAEDSRAVLYKKLDLAFARNKWDEARIIMRIIRKKYPNPDSMPVDRYPKLRMLGRINAAGSNTIVGKLNLGFRPFLYDLDLDKGQLKGKKTLSELNSVLGRKPKVFGMQLKTAVTIWDLISTIIKEKEITPANPGTVNLLIYSMNSPEELYDVGDGKVNALLCQEQLDNYIGKISSYLKPLGVTDINVQLKRPVPMYDHNIRSVVTGDFYDYSKITAALEQLRADMQDQNVDFIYTHCFSGMERSAMFIAAYLGKFADMTLLEASNYIKSKRSIAKGINELKFEQQAYLCNVFFANLLIDDNLRKFLSSGTIAGSKPEDRGIINRNIARNLQIFLRLLRKKPQAVHAKILDRFRSIASVIIKQNQVQDLDKYLSTADRNEFNKIVKEIQTSQGVIGAFAVKPSTVGRLGIKGQKDTVTTQPINEVTLTRALKMVRKIGGIVHKTADKISEITFSKEPYFKKTFARKAVLSANVIFGKKLTLSGGSDAARLAVINAALKNKVYIDFTPRNSKEQKKAQNMLQLQKILMTPSEKTLQSLQKPQVTTTWEKIKPTITGAEKTSKPSISVHRENRLEGLKEILNNIEIAVEVIYQVITTNVYDNYDQRLLEIADLLENLDNKVAEPFAVIKTEVDDSTSKEIAEQIAGVRAKANLVVKEIASRQEQAVKTSGVKGGDKENIVEQKTAKEGSLLSDAAIGAIPIIATAALLHAALPVIIAGGAVGVGAVALLKKFATKHPKKEDVKDTKDIKVEDKTAALKQVGMFREETKTGKKTEYPEITRKASIKGKKAVTDEQETAENHDESRPPGLTG